MNTKRNILLILLALFACIVIANVTFKFKSREELDVVAVNDVIQTLAEHWDQFDQSGEPTLEEASERSRLLGSSYGFDYVVINDSEELLYATRRGMNETINAAIRHQDTIVEIKNGMETLGKLIIYNDSGDKLEQYRRHLKSYLIVIMTLVAILCILYAVYYEKNVFQPFRKLKSFARHVAEGNLELPLEMDQRNVFGAFSESFDLMREEIGRARSNERMANQSKRELVASLSHDIKTPVASIIAVSELLYARSSDELLKNQLEIINSKADQINTLVTNLFNATLEELQELKVTVTEHSSERLYDLIRSSDYNHQVTIHTIDECLILIDELRLSQVIDNVISNSYKYAGTSIEVYTQVTGKYLEVSFKDYGTGVAEEERMLIFNKFYRGRNSADKSGTGLGLYISKYIMTQMSGDIEGENTEDGFVMKIKLKIA